MEKISPNLQAMKGTVIAMPGLGMSGKVGFYLQTKGLYYNTRT